MSYTRCEVSTNNIENLPDAPTLEASELKKKFDKTGQDIKSYINTTLIPEIETKDGNVETEIDNIKDDVDDLETALTNYVQKSETDLKVYEHTFTEDTDSLTIDLSQAGFSISDGDVLEIYFIGALNSLAGNTVETLAILPNGDSTFNTQRMHLTEFANNAVSTVGNNTVGVKNSLPRIARGNSGYRTICKTIMNYKGNYICSSLDYNSTLATTDSISGKANAIVGTIQSISSLVLDGVADNTYIVAGSKVIIYKI